MSIISDFKPYKDSLKREIKLQIQDQILKGYIQGEVVKYGSGIKYKESGHVDLIYIKETKKVKSVYFPGATGISIKTDPEAKLGIMAVYIGKKGKIHEIAILSHSFISSNKKLFNNPVYLMEANFLFLSLLQDQMLDKVIEITQSKKFEEIEHLQKIVNYFTGSSPIKIDLLQNIEKPYFPLNESQLLAYQKILSLDSDNFLTVIHGPPGTGKTQVIASAITCLLKRKSTILVTSHTNVAVDNALEKIIDYLIEQNIDPKKYVKRVGNPLRADTEKMVDYYVKEHPELSEFGNGLVVGSTISSLLILANSKKFNFSEPVYDYVFLDEASMANFPQSLVTMTMADKIILLGDPHQLPPIVKDEKATKDVLTSLFEKIIEKDPEVFTFLNTQYRSHPSIANYSSLVFYDGQLKSHESTRNKGLEIQTNDPILQSSSHLIWIDSMGGELEWKKLSGSFSGYNLFEVAIIGCLIKKFAIHGMNIGKDIRIITPFRLQAAIIEQMVREEFDTLVDLYESQTFPSASTIDRIQGREASIVIVSLVDDGANWRIHKVLQDYRRVNVGLTRAKNKLIVVGSSILKSSTAPIPYFRALGQYVGKFGSEVNEVTGCDMKYFNFAAEQALDVISKSK